MTTRSSDTTLVTIGVLTYGDYPHLVRRTVESIRTHCERSSYRLVVGANAAGAATRAYLEQLEADGSIDRLILSEANLNKCPMMSRMLEAVTTEFFWWFDDDSYIASPSALSDRLAIARAAPEHHVMWGHVFFFGHEQDFSYGTDVVGYVKRAPWYRGLEPPSWNPGGKGVTDFEGKGTGDGRWFFVTGGCWFVRTQALRDLDWPDRALIKRNDDVLLAEAIRQQGWVSQDIGPCGTAINTEPRRGAGEDQATMELQMGGPASATAGPAVTIGVLTFGDHQDLVSRAIDSIRANCDRSAYQLIVGANAVSDRVRAYLEGLEAGGLIDRLIISPTNINKCPMMRRMLAGVTTEFFWWFDDDSYIVSPTALTDRVDVGRRAPAHHVMWGHVFFLSHEDEFNLGTDVVTWIKGATWYRGLEPPSWDTGDGRWFFIQGGCWFIRTHVLHDLDWPDPTLIKAKDDVLLCEAIRQQGWEIHDIGPCGTEINSAPRRGDGEDHATMQQQMRRPGTNAPSRPAPGAHTRRFAGGGLLSWRVAHELTTRLHGNELIVSDTPTHHYHVLRLDDERVLYRRVHLRCVVRRLPGATTNFYVHHYGDRDVAEIGLDGTVVNPGITCRLDVTRTSEDVMEVDLEFLNLHPTLTIGCARQGQRAYSGDGREQFAIQEIEVTAHDGTAEFERRPDAERLVFVDVGGEGGLQLPWMLRADRIRPVVFEPRQAEAGRVRGTVGRIPGALVLDAALADTAGPRRLFVTADARCSSMREPDHDVLRRYNIAPLFTVTSAIDVECVRYDDLHTEGKVPRPDVIKVDVQGFEYEVLQGFGTLLDTCLGVELEAHVYPIYKGQKLLGDLVALLDGHGLVLRDLRPSPNFDGELVEVDVFFTKRKDAVANLSGADQAKFAVLTDAWRLPLFL